MPLTSRFRPRRVIVRQGLGLAASPPVCYTFRLGGRALPRPAPSCPTGRARAAPARTTPPPAAPPASRAGITRRPRSPAPCARA
ncbi:hypothetical protein APASM_5100 [Actinosynnema pretiosum subsp. pretiosum]|nr:hypothetical protein APASM_5100 [Actinosynnema pretiosum subsp. pretiosum]